ncbi:MAG: ubiquitinyl hydrolase 1 [Peltula sp. TS41687]|nr:MAG: ubiquitinyl hydrolase 1 [Peltula sp. TS41687]
MADPTTTTHTHPPDTDTDTDNPDVPTNAKAFIPLENNPDVMSSLVHKLGLSRRLSFHDVFSIDDADLLAFVPRPAYALLLVFPVSRSYEQARVAEDADRPAYAGAGPAEDVVWFKQTIRNACGLIGLLHGVANGEARGFVDTPSPLAELLADAVPLPPEQRAELLYHSSALESAHQSAAAKGDTAAPSAADDVDLHYVCFVKSAKTNRLWELDGRRKGPLDRGELRPEDDVLSPTALDLGVRRFLRREEEVGVGELRFSLVVLAPTLD